MKAVAQVFWVGGQVLNPLISANLESRKLNTTCWETNILAAFHYFENPGCKLVLWDIITSLIQISSVVGTSFMNLVVSKWLFSLGLVEDSSQGNGFLEVSTNFKQALSKVSCRCLHIVYVLFKRLYIAETAHDGAPKSVPQKIAGQFSEVDSEFHKKACREYFQEVEHELKERLVYFALTSKLLRLKEHTKIQHSGIPDDDSAGFMCMWRWARKLFQVQSITQRLTQYL
jgi:hypothetical protein